MRPARLALLGALIPAVLLAATAGVAVADHELPESPDGNVTVSVVDDGVAGGLSDAAAVRCARANGSTFDPPYYLAGDRLLVELRSPGLTEAYAAADGPNATARLFRATNGTDANITVPQVAVSPERQRSFVSLRRSDVRVVPDRDNETFFLLVDTGNVTLVADDGDRLDYDLDHMSYRVVLEAPAGDGGRQVSTADVVFEHLDTDLDSRSPALELDGRPPVLAPNDTVLSVNGSTAARANSTLTVRAVDSNGTVLAAEPVVTDAANDSEPHGPSTFAANLSVGSLSPTDSLRLSVERPEGTLWSRTVVVGEMPRLSNLSTAVVDGGERDGEVRVDGTVRLPDGGFLAVGDDGPPVVAPVPEGETVSRTLYASREAVTEDGTAFVFVMWDADGSGNLTDEDVSWHVRGDPDLSARVPVRTPESAETDAGTEMSGTPTETPAASTPGSETPSTTDGNGTAGAGTAGTETGTPGTETGTPGFGVLSAVAALLLAVAAARKRNGK